MMSTGGKSPRMVALEAGQTHVDLHEGQATSRFVRGSWQKK